MGAVVNDELDVLFLSEFYGVKTESMDEDADGVDLMWAGMLKEELVEVVEEERRREGEERGKRKGEEGRGGGGNGGAVMGGIEKKAKAVVKGKGSGATPAQFCHLCWRSTRKVKVAVCGNILNLACRKVICEKCFGKRGWDFAAALSGNNKWICTHCKGECPSKAQCYVYSRTNERRRQQRRQIVHNTPSPSSPTSA